VLSAGTGTIEFTRQLAEESVQRKAVQYDRDGDAHYERHQRAYKSIRRQRSGRGLVLAGPHARSGERPLSSPATGYSGQRRTWANADPAGLPLPWLPAQACELVGLPECQLNLAQGVTYLACAPKSNAATVGIGEARSDVPRRPLAAVPVHSAIRTTAGQTPGHGQTINTPMIRPTNRRTGLSGVDGSIIAPPIAGFENELAGAGKNPRQTREVKKKDEG